MLPMIAINWQQLHPKLISHMEFHMSLRHVIVCTCTRTYEGTCYVMSHSCHVTKTFMSYSIHYSRQYFYIIYKIFLVGVPLGFCTVSCKVLYPRRCTHVYHVFTCVHTCTSRSSLVVCTHTHNTQQQLSTSTMRGESSQLGCLISRGLMTRKSLYII